MKEGGIPMFRAMRRIKQQLSEAECIKVLKEGKRGTLAVCGDDGYPYAIPIDYHYDAERGSVFFHGAGEGHKIDSIRRSDKVTFNVLSEGWKENPDNWWLKFNSVTLFGRIHIVEDEALKKQKLYAIGLKYYPTKEAVDAIIQRTIDHVCILELKIELMSGKQVNEK
jgi:nitroimidazol reductase NimA-like FMN-containing flavoprotein (pyridoxamine 5'-phosphate oxidase superfamily)